MNILHNIFEIMMIIKFFISSVKLSMLYMIFITLEAIICLTLSDLIFQYATSMLFGIFIDIMLLLHYVKWCKKLTNKRWRFITISFICHVPFNILLFIG